MLARLYNVISTTSVNCFAGLIYLPEIKYRRILNLAFGPGGWALMPRGETLHYQVGIIYKACLTSSYRTTLKVLS